MADRSIASTLGSFKSVVTRHDSLFTVLGALIVFIGFFLKEGFQESSKELAASLSSTTFSTNVMLQLHSQADALVLLSPAHQRDFGSVPKSIDKDAVGYLTPITKRMDAFKDRLAISQNVYAGLQPLYEALPIADPETKAERQTLVTKINALIGKTDGFEPQLIQLNTKILASLKRNGGSIDTPTRGEIDAFDTTLTGIETDATVMSGELSSFQDNVFEEADDQSKTMERRAAWAKALSIVLFVIAWSMVCWASSSNCRRSVVLVRRSIDGSGSDWTSSC
jgi:hypothetical protein